jgi:hypothetical protein
MDSKKVVEEEKPKPAAPVAQPASTGDIFE